MQSEKINTNSELKVFEEGIIGMNWVEFNQKVSELADIIYNENTDMCRNVFELLPSKLFLYSKFYIINDIKYLHYDYSNYYLLRPYSEDNKIITLYENDFNNVFQKFVMLLNKGYKTGKMNNSAAVGWKIIRNISHKYFTEIWDNEYDHLLEKSPCKCNTVNDLIKTYCVSEILNPYNVENIAIFTHLAIQCNGLTSKNFVFSFDTLYNRNVDVENFPTPQGGQIL